MKMLRPFRLPRLAVLVSICSLLCTPLLQAGVTMSISDKGIEVDNGSDAVYVLEFPVLIVGEAKTKSKIENKVVADKSVDLTYQGGGSLHLELGEGGLITMKLSNQPEGTKFISSLLKIPASLAGAGSWKLGSTQGEFPQEAATPPLLSQGSQTTFTLTSPAGTATEFEIPPGTFQQLQDSRTWNTPGFFWQYWANVESTDSVTLSATSPGEAGSQPAASAPAKKATAPKPKDTASTTAPDVATKPRTGAAPAPLPTVALGESKVLKWKDGKRAPIMLEFDDSCEGHITNVIPELVKRKMVGTFYVVPLIGPYQNKKAQWEAAAKLPGIEIANHTAHHKGVQNAEELKSEVADCQEVIKALYPDRPWPRLVSFGTPGGVPWKVDKADFEATLAEHHLINRPSFQGPPLSYKGIDKTLDVVDNAIAKNEMGHIDFHGVGSDWHVSSIELFHALLDHLELNKDSVWVTDPVSYHQYATERKTAKVETLESKPDAITVQLTCEADPQFYNLPLTLVTGVPTDWTHCEVTQGDTTATVPVTAGHVQYNALPGPTQITLAKK